MGTSEALKLKLHSKINQFEIRLLNPWTDQVMITMFLFRIEFFAKSYSITNWFVQGCSWYFQMKLELFLSVRQIVSQGGAGVGGNVRLSLGDLDLVRRLPKS